LDQDGVSTPDQMGCCVGGQPDAMLVMKRFLGDSNDHDLTFREGAPVATRVVQSED